MNAKDKEKKAIVNAFLGKEADILVVDPIRYRQLADIKNKEFYEVEKDIKANDMIDEVGPDESETLSCEIIIHTLLTRPRRDSRRWQTVWKCRH